MLKNIIFAAVTLTFCFAATAQAQDAKLIKKGEEVYAANKCSMCHSIAGKGNAKGTLDGVGSKLTAQEIREWLTNPQEMAAKTKATRKPMKQSYKDKIAKDDMDALVAYLQSLKK